MKKRSCRVTLDEIKAEILYYEGKTQQDYTKKEWSSILKQAVLESETRYNEEIACGFFGNVGRYPPRKVDFTKEPDFTSKQGKEAFSLIIRKI